MSLNSVPQLESVSSSFQKPDYCFDPRDPWAQVFRRGLNKAGLADKRVWEVGVGIGANLAEILRSCRAKLVVGSDYDARVSEVARENLNSVLPSGNWRILDGSVNLLDANGDAPQTVDAIVACIPQAIMPADIAKGPDDTAHYYEPDLFNACLYNSHALGLQQALLRQARTKYPAAEVVLNLAGRVGNKVLDEMFRAEGYVPNTVHREVIPQCPQTGLGFFEKLEQAGGAM